MTQKKKTSKSALVLIIGLFLLVIAAGCLFAIYREGDAPDQVQNLKADVCHAKISLSWDAVNNSDGYIVYASKDGGEYEELGQTDKDTTEYSFSGYTHDVPYEFKVSAYSDNNLTGRKSEGESGMVSATYDSSKYAQKIPIITYHGFIPADMEPDSTLAMQINVFEEQMKYLHDNGYTTLTPDEFYQWHRGLQDYPKNTVMITIDDGNSEVYYMAYPIIKKYGLAATLFCIGKNSFGVTKETDPHSDKQEYVKDDVIKKVREEYPRFCFESHTYNMHERVNKRPPVHVFTHDQLMDDFKKNEPLDFKYLAYPWGNYSEAVQEVLKECNYKMAFAYRPFFYALRSDDTYAVNRIKISAKYDLDTFIKIVSGESESRDNPDAPENQ